MKFQSGSDINFGRALLISLLFHAILLWQPPPAIPRGMLQSMAFSPALALNASLRARPQPLPLAAVSPASSAARPDASRQASSMAAAPRSASAPVLLPETVTPDVAAAGEDAPDANGVRQYRFSLATAARRYQRYPQLALENGWSGTAEVAVAIAANGVPQPVQLLRSSGHALLDAAALEMMTQAALNAAVPASLQGRHLSIPLPVVFEHTEQ